jgi:GTPase
MRRIELPSGRTVILSDTVGFISELPTHLIAAFRATLEEVTEADLVIHVRDAHHPDSEAQRRDVLAVLTDLGLPDHELYGPGLDGGGDERVIEAMNKIDLLDAAARASLKNQVLRDPGRVALSAATGEGCDDLLSLIDRRLEAGTRPVRLDIPLSDGSTLAWVYRHGEVLGRRDDDNAAHLSVRLSEADIARLRHNQRAH